MEEKFITSQLSTKCSFRIIPIVSLLYCNRSLLFFSW